jgi:hypothetical protein
LLWVPEVDVNEVGNVGSEDDERLAVDHVEVVHLDQLELQEIEVVVVVWGLEGGRVTLVLALGNQKESVGSDFHFVRAESVCASVSMESEFYIFCYHFCFLLHVSFQWPFAVYWFVL